MKQIKFLVVSIFFASILFIRCKNLSESKVTSFEKTEMTDSEKGTAKTEISNTNTQIVSNLNALNVEAAMQGYSKNVKSVSVVGATLDYQTLGNDLKESFAGLKSFSLTKVNEDFLFISKTFVLCTWTGALEVELKTGERFKTDIHTASLLYSKIDNEWKIVYEHSSETPAKPVNSSAKDFIIPEKDIIPEGTAYNTKTNTIYIGSIYKQKIIAIRKDGSTEDIITQTTFEDLSPIGMEVDDKKNILWVNVALAPIVNKTGKTEWKTTIMSFDLLNNELIKKYDFIEGEQIFLNDLTIGNNGDVYATESVNGKIYKLDTRTNELAMFIDLANFSFPNGIVYYQPKNCLFVATNEGIVKVDIETKKIKLLEVESNVNAKVIDGLAINDDYFIGHQSTKISKFYFDKNIERIIRSEVFDSGNEFDSSTTGEVGNGDYHYIVNSQVRSGINREENKLKPLDSLENVIIRSKKL